MQFLVAQHIDKAIDWVASGWFDIDRIQLRDKAFDLIDEAIRLIDERFSAEEAEYLCHADVALVATALAVESVVDDVVVDWFVDDVLRFLSREARVRAALARAH